jgi:phosphatidylinositol dimannoside acyltransferase
MTRMPLFNPWQMNELRPLYEMLRELDPPDAYRLMREIHAAERRTLLAAMHEECIARVRPRLALAPRLVDEHDLDELARQFADYAVELSFETCYLIMNLANRERLFAEVVDMGNVHVLDSAREAGPVLLTPLHVGPCYASLGVIALRSPLTTLYHKFPLTELREQWAPELDLQGIQVPSDGVMRRCLEVLGSGRLLSMFPELDPNGIGPLHVPVPFFGTYVAAPTGPALVAQRAGAHVLPYTVSPTSDGRYTFRFEPPIDPGTTADDRRRVAARLFALAERTLMSNEPGKWEMWWDFDKMADHAWLESQRAAA